MSEKITKCIILISSTSSYSSVVVVVVTFVLVSPNKSTVGLNKLFTVSAQEKNPTTKSNRRKEEMTFARGKSISS